MEWYFLLCSLPSMIRVSVMHKCGCAPPLFPSSHRRMKFAGASENQHSALPFGPPSQPMQENLPSLRIARRTARRHSMKQAFTRKKWRAFLAQATKNVRVNQPMYMGAILTLSVFPVIRHA